MDRKILFQALDALNPNPKDIKAYYEQLCTMPMELVYCKDGEFIVTKQLKDDMIQNLFGILFPDTNIVIRFQKLTKDNFKPEYKTFLGINHWVNKTFGEHTSTWVVNHENYLLYNKWAYEIDKINQFLSNYTKDLIYPCHGWITDNAEIETPNFSIAIDDAIQHKFNLSLFSRLP